MTRRRGGGRQPVKQAPGEPFLSAEDIERAVAARPAVALYFTGPDCGVCRVLLPKLRAVFGRELPNIPLISVDAARYPAAAARLHVFAVPALLVFIDGKEVIRRSRNMSPQEVVAALARPYGLRFD